MEASKPAASRRGAHGDEAEPNPGVGFKWRDGAHLQLATREAETGGAQVPDKH